jgi:hypothetical protein
MWTIYEPDVTRWKQANAHRKSNFNVPGVYLRPFSAPDSFHAILADLSSCPLQQCRDAAISIATILASQFHDRPGQRVFIVTPDRLIALHAAWLMNQSARMRLTRSAMLRICLIHLHLRGIDSRWLIIGRGRDHRQEMAATHTDAQYEYESHPSRVVAE